VIPTAIVAAFLLGLLVGRWWVIPVVAGAWAALIGIDIDWSAAPGAFFLGAANALIGVALAKLLRLPFRHGHQSA
jgi:hypothetical protein